MPINMNNKVAKPQIWLHGDVIDADGRANGFSERYDNAIGLPAASTVSVSGVTSLDRTDILTFQDRVRVIITTTGPRPTYERESGVFLSQEFEGNNMFDTGGGNIDNVNEYAETWYTLNGKDPIRTAAQFYNFKDMNDAERGGNPSGDGPIDNLTSLGFVLRTNPTGSDLVTLKAKTYFQGEESRIAVAVFKIALTIGSTEFYQTPQ